jgi:hypothetical protein
MIAMKNSHMCDVMDEELHSSIEHMRTVVQNIMILANTKDTKSLESYCKTHETIIKHLLAYCNHKQETFKALVSPYVKTKN